MGTFQIREIGGIRVSEQGMSIELKRQYVVALKELDGFSHVNVVWWFSGCDEEGARNRLTVERPYRKAPAAVGTFATRSPERPNPIALSTAQIISIDHDKGIIRLAYIDADNGSPVLDLKPYTPSLDRVEAPKVPEWCGHWPKSVEQSGDYDWASEFDFA